MMLVPFPRIHRLPPPHKFLYLTTSCLLFTMYKDFFDCPPLLDVSFSNSFVGFRGSVSAAGVSSSSVLSSVIAFLLIFILSSNAMTSEGSPTSVGNSNTFPWWCRRVVDSYRIPSLIKSNQIKSNVFFFWNTILGAIRKFREKNYPHPPPVTQF